MESPVVLLSAPREETAGGVRKVCLDALSSDVATGGDLAKSVCTPWEYEQVSKMNLEGVKDVKSTSDKQGDDIQDVDKVLSGEGGSLIPGDFGLSAYMKFWSDVSGGNEYVTVALSVGVPMMIVAVVLAITQRQRGMGSHSHGSDPIARIRGARW